MKVREVRFQGIKGAQQPVQVQVEEDLTLICGRNDAGKSTILEVLNHFFNSKKLTQETFTVFEGESTNAAWIEVDFADLPSEVIIDSSAETTLDAERLINKDGHLTVRRSFTSSTVTESIVAKHPVLVETGQSLLELKLPDLSKLVGEWGLEAPKDRRKAASIRARLYEAEGKFEYREGFRLPEKLEGLKNIYPALRKSFPSFHLFQADMVAGENEKFIQDPANLVVEEVLARYESQLSSIAADIEADLYDSLKAVQDELELLSPTLATALKPSETNPIWKKAFSGTTFVDDDGVPLSSRGSGMRRLALLSFFRAHKRSAETGNDVIYAIEEPEAFLHPDLQIEIWFSLFDQSTDPSSQVILTSHSTNFIRQAPVESVRFLEGGNVFEAVGRGEGDSCVDSLVSVDGDQLVSKIEQSMGLLSDNNVRCFVLVEGANDITSLEKLTKGPQLDGVSDWNSRIRAGELVILPIGGCGSQKLFQSDRLGALNRPVYIFLDGDDSPAERLEVDDIVSGIHPFTIRLDCREMENLLSRDHIVDRLAENYGLSADDYSASLDEFWDIDSDRLSIDVPAACTKTGMKIADSDFDPEHIVEDPQVAKKFSKHESKNKKKLAAIFDELDLVSKEQILGSNLGTLLLAVERHF